MNREEAIEQKPCEDAISRRKSMLDYQQYLQGRMPNEENYKLWQFIKDLPSVMPKTEPCEDAVSREAVLAIAGDSCLDLDSYEDTKEFCDEIKELPSVTPAPKKCHNVNADYAECDQFVCSNCGIELQDWHRVEHDEDNGDMLYHHYEFKYCPNCGARIDSELPTV